LLESVCESWRSGDEVARARCLCALCVDSDRNCVAHPLHGAVVVAGGDQRRDVGVAKDVERWACLTWGAAAMGPSNAALHLLGKRSLIAHRCPRDLQKLVQGGWFSVKPVGQDSVSHAPKACHLRIVGRQEERGLEQCQRPYLRWSLDRGDDGPNGAVRVGDYVRTAVEHFDHVGSV